MVGELGVAMVVVLLGVAMVVVLLVVWGVCGGVELLMVVALVEFTSISFV